MKKSVAPIFILGISFLLLPGYAAAEIYKCKNEAGKTVFSDKKCGNKPELVKLKKYNQPERLTPRPFYCPSGISAVVNNLHYPTLESTQEAIRLAESDYTNLRYRKLIKKVDPTDVLPDRVSEIRAEAFLASEVPGFSNGVVVNVKICK